MYAGVITAQNFGDMVQWMYQKILHGENIIISTSVARDENGYDIKKTTQLDKAINEVATGKVISYKNADDRALSL